MPRYSISNVPTEVVGSYAGSGVFRERLGDIYSIAKASITRTWPWSRYCKNDYSCTHQTWYVDAGWTGTCHNNS